MTEAERVREPGFYWLWDEDLGWVVGQWSHGTAIGAWLLTGNEDRWTDHHFDTIGPRVEPPQETPTHER
ncbi:hypothetical protein HMPREF9946_03120 [Acetobacteraceae bacterium AT-5844]|nr:hypothetical protein HMPREF9946_03120 [Acetobacteraceae bacterium AT-5844]